MNTKNLARLNTIQNINKETIKTLKDAEKAKEHQTVMREAASDTPLGSAGDGAIALGSMIIGAYREGQEIKKYEEKLEELVEARNDVVKDVSPEVKSDFKEVDASPNAFWHRDEDRKTTIENLEEENEEIRGKIKEYRKTIDGRH